MPFFLLSKATADWLMVLSLHRQNGELLASNALDKVVIVLDFSLVKLSRYSARAAASKWLAGSSVLPVVK